VYATRENSAIDGIRDPGSGIRRMFAMITTRIVVVVLCALLAAQLSPVVTAQRAPAAMQPIVGTWQLSGLERGASGQTLSRVPNPVGMLIQSANGYVIEIVSQAARPATLNAAEQFMTYQAFWGTTTVEGNGSMASYHTAGDLDPGRTGQRFTRSFERKGTQLVLTDTAADGRPVMKTAWERIPE